jgi:hypothetical protein
MPRHPWAVSSALNGKAFQAVNGYTLIADQGSREANEEFADAVERLVYECSGDASLVRRVRNVDSAGRPLIQN